MPRYAVYNLCYAVLRVPVALGMIRAVDPGKHLRRSGGMLIVANHSSFLDPWFIGATIPRTVRYLMNARWYYRSPMWKRFFESGAAIPIADGDTDETVARVIAALRAGEIVGVFPEGKISRDGTMGRFRPGIGFMAALSGVPVLPVALRGAYRCLPRHRRIPRPVRVRVHVGEPVTWPGAPLVERPRVREALAFAERLEAQVRRLLGESEGTPGRAVAQRDAASA
ncbi:MAG: lysophospholipid acyltransferase family protein [Acidobacteriota bacterium]